jgi:hypothetical protein
MNNKGEVSLARDNKNGSLEVVAKGYRSSCSGVDIGSNPNKTNCENSEDPIDILQDLEERDVEQYSGEHQKNIESSNAELQKDRHDEAVTIANTKFSQN